MESAEKLIEWLTRNKQHHIGIDSGGLELVTLDDRGCKTGGHYELGGVPTTRILVTQLVDDLSDHDDQEEMPAGDNERHASKFYDVPFDFDTEDECLDWFSFECPIAMPEEFDVRVVHA